jgi:hypothetical protein
VHVGGRGRHFPIGGVVEPMHPPVDELVVVLLVEEPVPSIVYSQYSLAAQSEESRQSAPGVTQA